MRLEERPVPIHVLGPLEVDRADRIVVVLLENHRRLLAALVIPAGKECSVRTRLRQLR
jgi:hypothetical protein